MNKITSPTTGTTKTNPLSQVWRELDCIYLDDCDLLTRAAESITAVKAGMLSGKQIDCSLLSETLEAALQDIRTSSTHLENVIEALGLAA